MTDSTGYLITTAHWNDAYNLHQVSLRCFGEEAHPFLELLGQLTLPGYTRLKAVIDEQIVGFVIGEKTKDKEAVWIAALGVATGYRRRGIGEALLAACEKQMEFPRVCLCVRVSNHPAITLYENNGYHKLKVLSKYYLDGEDAFVMEKQGVLDVLPQARYI